MQLTIFDRAPTRPDPAFRRAVRHELGRGAWVEWVPGWLEGADEIFSLLLATAGWEQHRRKMYERVVDVPRLVAAEPGAVRNWVWEGDVGVHVIPSCARPSDVERARRTLRALQRELEARYGRALPDISLAYYRDGQDSVAFHGDKLGALRPDTIVAIVSVGARRRFVMRPVRNPDPARVRALGDGAPNARVGPDVARAEALAFDVGEGDLLVMGGSCQETWEHGIPKVKQAGPRIAIMFRERLERAS